MGNDVLASKSKDEIRGSSATMPQAGLRLTSAPWQPIKLTMTEPDTIADDRAFTGAVLLAQTVRRTMLEQSKRANVGHIGSCLSVVEILAAVYGGVFARAGPTTPIAIASCYRRDMPRSRSTPRWPRAVGSIPASSTILRRRQLPRDPSRTGRAQCGVFDRIARPRLVARCRRCARCAHPGSEAAVSRAAERR